jgi:hypothetical protein
MDETIKYRGRIFSVREVDQAKEVIASNPGKSRRFISQELCRLWDWTQPNGVLKDMVCRGLLKQLEVLGLVVLPPRKKHPPNPFLNRTKPEPASVDQSPLVGDIAAIKPIELFQVRRTSQERLYNSLIEHHHFLGYAPLVGEHVKYVAFARGRPIACVGWCSAPRHIGCRDRHIGWNQDQRKRNISLLATNTRFLILPWVRVPHLASHLLGLCARTIAHDWKRLYNHEIVWLETFVDPERGFKGTCYKAANWIYLGLTTGRGKDDRTNKVNRSLKYVFGYPIKKDFRWALHDYPLRKLF